MDFFRYSLAQTDLRESTCHCLQEIVHKGMEPFAKLKIIDYLWTSVIEAYANMLINERECDYLLKFGKLLNTIGTDLAECWQKLKRDENSANMFLAAMESRLSHVVFILRHEDDDISESVSEYCQSYIAILKTLKVLNPTQKTYVQVKLNFYNLEIF